MSRTCDNYLLYQAYLIYDEEGGAIGLRADAPEKAKKAWEDDNTDIYDENGELIIL